MKKAAWFAASVTTALAALAWIVRGLRRPWPDLDWIDDEGWS